MNPVKNTIDTPKESARNALWEQIEESDRDTKLLYWDVEHKIGRPLCRQIAIMIRLQIKQEVVR